MASDPHQLVGDMTLEEKASLLSGADFWHTAAIERLGVPAIMCSDGPHGLRAQPRDSDHVGLSGSLPATCFPTASAIASSWDVDLLREVGAALAAEARACGVAVILGPGVNIKRSPLCGRNFEYFSEDPFLSGELGVAIVDGVQSGGVGTSVKHFAANNQEDDRLRVSADVDERTLREIYLPAFERIVTGADPWTVMCAYNKVNGTHASEHHWLLTELLRDEWGWEGVVVSDWGACHDRVAALEAGLDWEMPPDLPHSPESVAEAVRSGRLDERTLDRSVRRMLAMIDKAQAVTDATDATALVDHDAHHQLARRAAAESIVLLKNDGGLLPLAEGAVAVIGEFARTPRFQGAGSSQVNPTGLDSALDAFVAAVGAESVDFAPGYAVDDADSDADHDRLVAEAVSVAARAEVVVCFLGLPGSYESEGFDRTHMELPDEQLVLLDAVVAANPNVAVVLVNGGIVRTSGWDRSVPAVVEAWLGGQAAGGAIVDVLTGVVNPSGRLAETVPLRLNDNSAALNFPGDSGHVRYGEGIFVGYRAHDRLDQPVSYPFGFGLSYTTFELGEPTVTQAGSVAGGDLTVAVELAVTNTGRRAGAEVIQVYVADTESTVARPPRELKGFAKIRLDPGETGTVQIGLDQRAFSYWSELVGRWVVEAGEFRIEVGTSSRDLPRSAVVTIEAPSVRPPLTEWSTLREWLDDEHAGGALRELAKDDPLLSSDEVLKVIGTMPLQTIAKFPGVSVGRDELAELVRRFG